MKINAKYPSPTLYFGTAMINDLLTLKDNCDKYLKDNNLNVEDINLEDFGFKHSNYPEYTGLYFDDFYCNRISLETCVHKNMMHLLQDIIDGTKHQFVTNKDYATCPYYDDIDTMKAAYADFINFIQEDE